ncbi:7,8-didemethyl-8-hydroxy-5-deazariboflavin synthase subunit CofG [Kovacikia minuta CCNUW1]|uniref:7,8-didemethyl-8-hydroxy-5-deazariboflavin synthase subunit CofG n=1 Tax=Kovacikia minuta TaxID=2931930 RepID=UPI001CCC6FA7|nr:7,8-didemethyl-8-hydroxy-5-deazariboflavin synthase subunit CofG [Kovacikia minuta]UBF26245.1 7,8-didemethyl-8-hydroxy-5-deazariboflavin synthase subunit CofG [Kovacikia minuta CCNUW1]
MTKLPKTVTYSPAYTIVPTYECFNRCHYCNFRTDPRKSPWLTLMEAEALLQPLKHQGVIEILVLSGEVHPQSSRRADWFWRIYNLCELALSLGFLPHTNVGPLSFSEMKQLKAVNVSMGLMLEQITPELLRTVHRHAPSKVPELRLQQLEWAGELEIPFTTGLLLGIGETQAERRETLTAIAQIHQRWGHIQEVILQPYSPGQRELWGKAAFHPQDLVELVAAARQILPNEITLQIPPNLIQEPQYLLACLEAGARDLGGIGPRDEVNPDYPHPIDAELAQTLLAADWLLIPRLPIYPKYDSRLPPPLQTAVQKWRAKLSQLDRIVTKR